MEEPGFNPCNEWKVWEKPFLLGEEKEQTPCGFALMEFQRGFHLGARLGGATFSSLSDNTDKTGFPWIIFPSAEKKKGFF